MTLFCKIIDDDPSVLEQLSDFIQEHPNLKLTGSYTNPLLAIEGIVNSDEQTDIVFTDVEMPELSGLELVKIIEKSIRSIILVSGHLKYATRGYDFSKVGHFLDKPFDFRKFTRVVDVAISKLSPENDFIMAPPVGQKHNEKIQLSDITAVVSDANYLHIYTTGEQYFKYGSLHSIEKQLFHTGWFRRISRSAIINPSHIKEQLGNRLKFDLDVVVSVSRSFQKDFNAFYKNFLNPRTIK